MALEYPASPGIFLQNVCLTLNKMDNHQNKFYTRATNSTKIDLFQLFLGIEPLHCGYPVPWPL
jgi:hypothetical protein